MTNKLDTMRSAENLKAASAMVEVAAMARVGVLSAGSEVTRQRATQLDRDAIRLERRGKTARASELRAASVSIKKANLSMNVQREKEQIRPMSPTKDTALVQGRVSKEGVGKAGLTVRLVDAEGTVLDRTKSSANGAFALKQGADIKDARIVVADLDGTDLGVMRTPVVTRSTSLFVDLPIERLDPAADRGLTMPRVLGMNFEEAAAIFDDGLTLGGIKLKKVSGQAGIVLDQSPEPDTPVKRGTAVKLRVGTGNLAKDYRTARALVRLDPAIAEVGLDSETLRAAEDKLELTTLNDLAKLPEMDSARLAEVLPRGGEAMAKIWQATVKRVLTQFPGR